MEMASSLVAGFTEVVWASWWKICESRFKYRWFQHNEYNKNAKSNSIDRLYRPLNCICTENICRVSRHFQLFRLCWSECDVASGTLAMAAIVCWQSVAGCAESKSDQICEIRPTNLPYVAQQVGIVHFYAVTEIKGLSCRLRWMDEWRNLLTSPHVGHWLCHVGSREWRVTKIWGPRCKRD